MSRFVSRPHRFTTVQLITGFTRCLLHEPSSPRFLARSATETFVGHPLLSFSPSSSTKASGFFAGFVATTTASADSSHHCCQRRPFRREARSPQVRASTFDARPADLRRRALATRASRSFVRSPRSTPPLICFLFIGPTSSLHASSPRSVTLPQLRFASFTLACSRKDFHLRMDAHAGRTKGEGPALLSWAFKPRQRPTLPQGCPCSTIGPGELNFRVRDGNGCDLSGITARKKPGRSAKLPTTSSPIEGGCLPGTQVAVGTGPSLV